MQIHFIPLYPSIDKPFSISFKSDGTNLKALLENHHRSCIIGNVHVSAADKNGERDVTVQFIPIPNVINDSRRI